MQKGKDVWDSHWHLLHRRSLKLRRLLVPACYVLHSHENLIDSSDILLNLSNIMLQNSELDTLCASKSFHNSSVFVPDIFVNDALNCLDLVDSMIKSHDLTNQLSSLGHQAVMNRSIDDVKSVSKGFFHC